MSNLLKEAIVDAKALKEAALKNAEASIIEKYSTEVKNTFDKLLEQEDLGLAMGGESDLGAMEEPALGSDTDLLAAPGGIEDPAMADAPQEDIVEDDEVPLAAADGLSDKTSKLGAPVKFDLDLGALQEAIGELQATQQMLEEEAELDVSEEEIFEILTEDEEGVFAPNHYCVHHGGVEHNGSIEMAEAVSHNYDKKLDRVTHYDMKLSDGTVLENISTEDIQVTNASLAEEHSHSPGKRDEDDPEKEEPEEGESEEGEDEDSDSLAAQAPPEDKVTSADFQNLKKGKTYRESVDDDLDLDSLVNAITEKLTVDMGADLAGWAGRSSEDKTYQIEKEMAYRRNTDVEEELKDLKKAHEELVFENKQLNEQLLQYKQATNELKEGLQDVNISNARLLYTNRVLRDTSLNERQKETIVEAISKAGSVAEARTILDTLQSTVQSTPKRGPKSLNEAITRRSSVIRASRHDSESTSSDPFQDRMKRLAGIKK
jgi:hypothetical protein